MMVASDQARNGLLPSPDRRAPNRTTEAGTSMVLTSHVSGETKLIPSRMAGDFRWKSGIEAPAGCELNAGVQELDVTLKSGE
jgi:hypothetical protein